MNLGFQDRFIPRIESGDKRHSIRKGNRWRVGMTAHLWKNMRGRKNGPKPQTLIFIAPVVKVERITIQVYDPVYQSDLSIWIEGVELTESEKQTFAQRDGFDGSLDMHRFWAKEHGVGVRFFGQIVHWDFKQRRVPDKSPNARSQGRIPARDKKRSRADGR